MHGRAGGKCCSVKNTMKLYIRNMVSLRCLLAVRAILKKMGLPYQELELGMVELAEDISPCRRIVLKKKLLRLGLKLRDGHKSILIEKIKAVIIKMISRSQVPRMNTSAYICKKMSCDYTYLANVFSQGQGITIQQFIILQKIEVAKKMLHNDELTLTAIARHLHYSSISHLSAQFKKVTGLSPLAFKQLQHGRTSQFDSV